MEKVHAVAVAAHAPLFRILAVPPHRIPTSTVITPSPGLPSLLRHMAPLDSFLSRFSSRLHRRDQQAVGRARQNDDENWREHVAMRPSEPPPRTHTITPGPTDTPGASVLARAQQQSPLFHKLPAEIRLQIWTEVVGRQTVHILLQDRRLSHVECYAPDMEDWWRHGCILQRWDGVVPYIGRTRDGRTADGGKLGLLLACRQM